MYECSYTQCFSATVISEPDNVTIICEGKSTLFTCVLDSSISRDDVQWYRLLKDTGTTERIGRLNDFTVVPIANNNSFTTRLYIFNAIKSYTGYYWVRLSSDNVCSVSLTVTTSMYIHNIMYIDFIICNNSTTKIIILFCLKETHTYVHTAACITTYVTLLLYQFCNFVSVFLSLSTIVGIDREK